MLRGMLAEGNPDKAGEWISQLVFEAQLVGAGQQELKRVTLSLVFLLLGRHVRADREAFSRHPIMFAIGRFPAVHCLQVGEGASAQGN